jgi:hypothetical protein
MIHERTAAYRPTSFVINGAWRPRIGQPQLGGIWSQGSRSDPKGGRLGKGPSAAARRAVGGVGGRADTCLG